MSYLQKISIKRGKKVFPGRAVDFNEHQNKKIFKFYFKDMGVSHYNCCCCERIFADVSGYLRCESCNAKWCNRCYQSFSGFQLGEEMFCDECFEDVYEPSTKELLEYACHKLNTTVETLKREMPKPEPKYEYTCSLNHNCGNSACERVSLDFPDEFERKAYDDIDEDNLMPQRGVCCLVRYKDDDSEWCEACKEASRNNTKRLKTASD